MSNSLLTANPEAKAALAKLFDSCPPLLVEIRFPNMGTSPDWHLCDEEDQLDNLLDRLGPGVEVHVSSVWDLKNVKGDICLRK